MPGARQPYRNAWLTEPSSNSGGDFGTVTLALRMQSDVDGRIVGVRFFRDLSDGGHHVGMLWDAATLELLDVCLFHRVAAAGSGADSWHSAYFRKFHTVPAAGRFVVGVMYSDGNYWLEPHGVDGVEMVNGNLTITADGDGGSNGLFGYGQVIPIGSFGGSAYGVDVIFLED